MKNAATDVRAVASPAPFLAWERLQKFGSRLFCWKILPGSSRFWVPVLLSLVRESVLSVISPVTPQMTGLPEG